MSVAVPGLSVISGGTQTHYFPEKLHQIENILSMGDEEGASRGSMDSTTVDENL